jgi:hypothetical protein
VRNFTIAMAAYNVRYFFSASCVAQAGNWYGRQHYGGAGYLRRAPELNPMPAAAAYATYTRIFDGPRPDTWVVHKTGSLSAFAASCLRMFRPGRAMALWALRGERPATIVLSRDAEAIVTRMTGRSERVNSKDRRIEVTLRPDPVYVELPTISNASDIASIELGQPTYAERPAEGAKVVEDFARGFAWQPSDERRVSYETNKITEPRFKGKLLFTHAGLTGRDGMGLRCELPLVASNQWHTANVAPLYTILRHTGGGIELPGRPFDSAQGRPELVEGRPTKIGFWCRGNSSWARIIPVLVDAKGERWTFIGNPLKGKYKAEAEQAEIAAKGGDGWNSEDMHSWSAVNHDGWRYMEMELPSTFAGDKARGPGQVWWREDLPSPAEAGYAKAGGGDNIVDYPLKLVELILEMYTGVVYMGEWVPIQGENAIEIDDITVAYDDPFEGKWEE